MPAAPLPSPPPAVDAALPADADVAAVLAESAPRVWWCRRWVWAAAALAVLAGLCLWGWLVARAADAAPSYTTTQPRRAAT